jgi:hypothetical protein
MEASIPSPLPQNLHITGTSVHALQEDTGSELLVFSLRSLPRP